MHYAIGHGAASGAPTGLWIEFIAELEEKELDNMIELRSV